MSDEFDRDKVLGLVKEVIDIAAPDADLSNVRNDVRLRDQLDMDSMDFLDIVMELRKRFKIEVVKEDYDKLATIDSCVDYLGPMFKKRNYQSAKSYQHNC